MWPLRRRHSPPSPGDGVNFSWRDATGGRRKRRALAWTFGVLAGLILLVILTSLPFAIPAFASAKTGRAALLAAQAAALKTDFETANRQLEDAAAKLEKSRRSLSKLFLLKALPITKTQLAAADHLLAAGGQLATGLQRLVTWADGTFGLLDDDAVKLSTLSPEETRILLKRLAEAEPELQGVKAQIDLASQSAGQIPKRGLLGPVRKTIEPFQAQLRELQASIGRIVPLSRFLPPLVGYPEGKTYLFLLQNNTELRPSGGFIGTYGILALKDGQITSFHTDNSYNLDLSARGKLKVTPPDPLARYNYSEGWFFRDSNWSPDFPTAAAQAGWFYRAEGGTARVDGVMAVTPSFVSSLLELTGPIEVNGTKVDAKNLVEFLRFQVDEGYLREGLPFSERKEVIGVLADKLMAKLYDLDTSKWPALWRTIERNIDEKQIFLSLDDAELQAVALATNWAGAVRETNGDYLFVVDANIGSLKTDPFVSRSINYAVRRVDGELRGQVTITYDHQGELSKNVSRYRSYTRVYVPAGSELLEADGPMVDCKLARKGSVETASEFGKVVFGFFSCTEPKEQRTVTLTYRLPERLTKQLENGRYELLVQKQGGAAGYPLTLAFDVGDDLKDATLLDGEAVTVDNGKTIQTALRRDREFTLFFK